MAVDVPVALLGYGTVGAAVHRLLLDSGDDIERATGHRLRLAKALVRDPDKERGVALEPGLLTRRPGRGARLGGGDGRRGDGRRRPRRRTTSSTLLRAGKHVVTANKQLVAQRGPELFAAAAATGAQLRFEASVCAAIPVIKVLREALVVSNVHRVLGIVNGTTNFVLGAMEEGRSYGEALAEAQRLGYAEADPTDDVSGADAAAKMAILATVAFGGRVPLDAVHCEGIEHLDDAVFRAARALDMHVKLIGEATLVDGRFDVRVGPALVDSHHPLAAVEGAYNAVMLQGDSIREITLEGPGAGGIETASAVVADMVSILGTTGTGFLQDDPVRRELTPLPAEEHQTPAYLRIEVDDRPGVLSTVAGVLAERNVSIARLVQVPSERGAVLHVVAHRAPFGAVHEATLQLVHLDEARESVLAVPVISDRGVAGMGWE